MLNDGNFVASVSQLARCLAERAEALGAMILPEIRGARCWSTDGRVVGVRTGDKGRGRDGEELGEVRAGLRHRRAA